MSDQDYDITAFSPLRLITSMVLGSVFHRMMWPAGDPNDDGDGLHVHYCEYVKCAGCKDHQLRVEGILSIKDDPQFVRILRARIHEELGKQLLFFPPLSVCEEQETSSLYVEVGDA